MMIYPLFLFSYAILRGDGLHIFGVDEIIVSIPRCYFRSGVRDGCSEDLGLYSA